MCLVDVKKIRYRIVWYMVQEQYVWDVNLHLDCSLTDVLKITVGVCYMTVIQAQPLCRPTAHHGNRQR